MSGLKSTDAHAAELFTLGIAGQDGIVDDGRTWWYVGAHIWPSIHAVDAPNGRAAIAQFRRAVIDAEIAKGDSRRGAIAYIRAAGLYIVDGPLTTPQAYECEVGWAWAWALCHFSSDVPLYPATEADLWPHVAADRAAVLRAQVRGFFLKDTKGSN